MKDASADDRKGFIKKVYAILGCQLLVTACITLYPFLQSIQGRYEIYLWMYENKWILILAMVLAIVVECAILCVPQNARQVPTNYILLGIFTLCESYLVCFVCSRYEPRLVMMAMFMTAGVVLALSLYAVFTTSDFTIMGGGIVMVAFSIMMFGMFAIIFQDRFLYMFYVWLVILLVGFYIIIDT